MRYAVSICHSADVRFENRWVCPLRIMHRMRTVNIISLTAALLTLMALATACQFADPFSPDEEPATVLAAVASQRVAVEGRVQLPPGVSPDTLINLEVSEVPESPKAEMVAEGLEIPWDLAFTPDGRILVTERPGRIRVFQDGVLLTEPYATIDVAHVSEAGLMGIALHPDFSDNGFLYVCYTYRDGSQMFNRIARLTDREGQGTDHTPILDGIPGSSRHDGCRIRFGPDGYLYATTGDATDPDLAQDLGSLAGKVLRLAADGSIPADNPFPNSHVYTYGHRNPQGLDWHPKTGDLFITEHGPSRDDEVNLLEPGKNYGWPEVTGTAGKSEYVDPLLSLTPTVAIAGAAFVSEGNLPASWEGNLVFAALKASHLQLVVLEPPEFRSVATAQTLFQSEFGRLRAVVMGPDSYLYFTTSNRDGRGSPRPGDDRLLRLAPAAPRYLTQLQVRSGDTFRLELPPGTYLLRWEAPQVMAVERRIVVAGAGGLDLGTVELKGEGN